MADFKLVSHLLSWSFFAGVSLALLFFIVSSSSMSFRRAAWFSMIGKLKSSAKLWFCWSAGSGRITFGVRWNYCTSEKGQNSIIFLNKNNKIHRKVIVLFAEKAMIKLLGLYFYLFMNVLIFNRTLNCGNTCFLH